MVAVLLCNGGAVVYPYAYHEMVDLAYCFVSGMPIASISAFEKMPLKEEETEGGDSFCTRFPCRCSHGFCHRFHIR